MSDEITFSQFNAFDYMTNDDEIIEFLKECWEDEDPSVFITALGHLIKKRGVTKVANKAGLNRESLYKVLNGKSQPAWTTVHRLMHALDIHLTIAA